MYFFYYLIFKDYGKIIEEALYFSILATLQMSNNHFESYFKRKGLLKLYFYFKFYNINNIIIIPIKLYLMMR